MSVYKERRLRTVNLKLDQSTSYRRADVLAAVEESIGRRQVEATPEEFPVELPYGLDLSTASRLFDRCVDSLSTDPASDDGDGESSGSEGEATT